MNEEEKKKDPLFEMEFPAGRGMVAVYIVALICLTIVCTVCILAR